MRWRLELRDLVTNICPMSILIHPAPLLHSQFVVRVNRAGFRLSPESCGCRSYFARQLYSSSHLPSPHVSSRSSSLSIPRQLPSNSSWCSGSVGYLPVSFTLRRQPLSLYMQAVVFESSISPTREPTVTRLKLSAKMNSRSRIDGHVEVAYFAEVLQRWTSTHI